MQRRPEDPQDEMQQFAQAATAAVLSQTERWAGIQCALLSDIEALWTGWMQRQSEAIDLSARSLAQIYECTNLTNLLQTQQQWLADTARRTAADWSALAKDAADLSWRVARVDPTGDQTRGAPPPQGQQDAREQASQHREAAK